MILDLERFNGSTTGVDTLIDGVDEAESLIEQMIDRFPDSSLLVDLHGLLRSIRHRVDVMSDQIPCQGMSYLIGEERSNLVRICRMAQRAFILAKFELVFSSQIEDLVESAVA